MLAYVLDGLGATITAVIGGHVPQVYDQFFTLDNLYPKEYD